MIYNKLETDESYIKRRQIIFAFLQMFICCLNQIKWDNQYLKARDYLGDLIIDDRILDEHFDDVENLISGEYF
jgi:hypothetical protein